MRLAMTPPRAPGGNFSSRLRTCALFSAATEGGATALGWRGLMDWIAADQRAVH